MLIYLLAKIAVNKVTKVTIFCKILAVFTMSDDEEPPVDLICCICFELLVDDHRPVALGCGHILCKNCVGRVRICPQCNKPIASSCPIPAVLHLAEEWRSKHPWRLLSLFVRSWDSRPPFSMQFKSEETIEEVRTKIKERTNWPMDELRMICRGQILSEERTLASYGVQNHDTIHVNGRVKGA
jgi:hypothetical protein